MEGDMMKVTQVWEVQVECQDKASDHCEEVMVVHHIRKVLALKAVADAGWVKDRGQWSCPCCLAADYDQLGEEE